MDTIYRRFRQVAQGQPERPSLFWKEAGSWRHWSYAELLERVDRLAAGLSAAGLVAAGRLAILSENRPEWVLADLAANRLGATSVPIHTTAKDDFVGYAVKDSGACFLLVSQRQWLGRAEFLAGLIRERGLTLVLFDLVGAQPVRTGLEPGSRLMSQLMAVRQEAEPSKSEPASIIYTSGTTGEAKGVMLSNDNLLSNALAGSERIAVSPEDKFLSFLPLSHVLERTAGCLVPLLNGASIAFAEGIKELSQNLKEVRPTILISVPKIFERMLERIFSEMKAKPKPVRKLFYGSLKKGPHGRLQQLVDRLFCRRVQAVLGGRLRFAVCGGAAVNERVLRFFKNMGVAITEGYGLTEASPIVAVNPLDGNRLGTVGRPLDGVEVRIGSDKEILVRGRGVMQGYWQKPELTAEAVDQVGWLRTGDLGFMDKDGYLTVVGRKKDMLVTSNGKNIFPEKIEGELNLSPYIGQSLVVGHRRGYLAALIVPDFDAIRQELPEAGNLSVLIQKEVDRVNGKLAHFEAIRKFALLDKPWSIEAEELTPTLKLRRHVIEKRYGQQIEKLF